MAAVRFLQIGLAFLLLRVVCQLFGLQPEETAWHGWLIFGFTVIVSTGFAILEWNEVLKASATTMTTWMAFYALVLATGAAVAFL